MVWNKWTNKDYINYCINNNLNLPNKLKREYAKNNGYKLLELPYTLDTYKDVENYINNELLI